MTADGPQWPLPEFDPTTPNPARIYDYALGGKDNFPPDREALRHLEEVFPEAVVNARQNREFLVRAVEVMARDGGVTQFLDLGTGIPTSPNVHEVARRTHPDARVVYVDNDPTVLAHARALLAKRAGVVVVGHDIRAADDVLTDPALLATLDLSRPVGLLAVGVLHYVAEDVAPAIMARLRRDLAPGSMLALSTFSSDDTTPEIRQAAEETFAPVPIYLRSRAQIAALFEGFDLLDPGLTSVAQWRHDGPSLDAEVVGGVGTRR